jgi:hypothetical protein
VRDKLHEHRTDIAWKSCRHGHNVFIATNRVLRRTLRRKRKEVTRGLRKFHTEQLYNLYFPSSNVVKSRMLR